MNSRRLFSKMAQIVILIILIVLACFLIKGFAWGYLQEKKRIYHSERDDSFPHMKKWEEIGVGLTHTKNMNNEEHDLARKIKIKRNT